MSLNTRFYSWRIQPRRGISGGAGVLAGGLMDFWLDGSDPEGLQETPAPDPSAPVRNVIPHPTARVVYSRRRVAGGPAVEVAPRPGVEPFPVMIPAEQRFEMTFVGVGPSGGLPVSATISFSSDSSFGGDVHFMDWAARRAGDFMGDGAIIDVSAGVGEVWSGQIVLLSYPWNVLGGAADLAHRLQRAFTAGRSIGWQDGVRMFLTPRAGAAAVSGYSSGAAAGVTLYTGIFYVRECPAAS